MAGDQMDMFGQLDLFGNYPEQPKVPAVQAASPDCSANGLVNFKYNPLLKKSIRCKGGVLFGHPEVMLPAYMRDPEFTAARELAAEWAEHAVRRKTQKNKAIIKDLVTRFWTVVDQVLVDRGEKPLESRNRIPPIRPKGKYHDLNDILAAVNDTYFDGSLNCRITWSNRVGGLSYHTTRKDPLTGEDFHLISISKGYDAANCPKYAVAGVVYHECLHIVIPVEMRNGRRVVHGRVFRQRERRYIFYDEWTKWHKDVLPRNIRALLKHKEL
ncbi:SprT-like domain-containing protein [Fibrobacter sp. UWP2]|jgi:hypothetical protein|uniref:SprT-like domain-containing protein n=1 Tax=Fibrobacter sp. UWP2 TaxID=1896216 RepID=UPI00091ECBF0|nr:SprT-like domain-containing protein [Fibrobacter sp. UWP2]SHJ43454.1 hypothetical protein SAMN05720471_1396 [Fibrobacter sp. UWP2]